MSTKENRPNNQQTLLQDIISPAYDQALGKSCERINVDDEFSITEETVTTNSDYVVASENNLTASDFQDACCGEPIKKQLIRLDFTPKLGIDDNDEVLKKCNDFWGFLKEHTELQHLKVGPEHITHDSVSEASIEHHPVKNDVKIKKLAAMDWVKKDDLITNAIRKLGKQRYCEHISEDYCEARAVEQRDKIAQKRRSRLASSTDPSSKSDGRSKPVSCSQGRRTSLYDVEELVSQMNKWDLKHSRRLDAPHFPHALSQMTMLPSEHSFDTVDEKMSCCQLSCIPECPSAAENTNKSAHEEAA